MTNDIKVLNHLITSPGSTKPEITRATTLDSNKTEEAINTLEDRGLACEVLFPESNITEYFPTESGRSYIKKWRQ